MLCSFDGREDRHDLRAVRDSSRKILAINYGISEQFSPAFSDGDKSRQAQKKASAGPQNRTLTLPSISHIPDPFPATPDFDEICIAHVRCCARPWMNRRVSTKLGRNQLLILFGSFRPRHALCVTPQRKHEQILWFLRILRKFGRHRSWHLSRDRALYFMPALSSRR